MKKYSRPILIGVLMTVILLNSACNALVQTNPTPVGTILPGVQTQSPVPTSTEAILLTATNTPVTPSIPITGENIVEMQCQFCVNDLAHAIFIFPEFANFDVETTTPVTCLTAKVINGKRVLVCNGTQLTSFKLKICSDSSNCLLFPVALKDCPLAPDIGTSLTGTPSTPTSLTPVYQLPQPTRTPDDDPSAPVPSQVPTQTDIAPTQPTTYP